MKPNRNQTVTNGSVWFGLKVLRFGFGLQKSKTVVNGLVHGSTQKPRKPDREHPYLAFPVLPYINPLLVIMLVFLTILGSKS